MDRPYLKDFTEEELKTLPEITPAYRARQVFAWLHRGVGSAAEMTDLPKSLREALDAHYVISKPAMLRRQISSDGTRKYLWGLADGNCVETVLMHYAHGVSVCVSTQAGCRMGCVFCASTKNGLARNLLPSEILDQVIFSGLDAGVRVSHIVLMGTGEPLDNYDNVLRFLKLVGAPGGLHIGARNISLSTSGLVDQIDRLAREHLQITLSVSLHAPNDTLRRQIMPVARAWPMERLLASCGAYFEETGRRVSYEYIMIRGFNDTPACARELAAKLAGTGAHVNMIRLNDIAESPLKPSTPEAVRTFQQILQSSGVNATVRRRLGADIDAACGQLRKKQLDTH
ncbi:MAG: 23S rRNA (adenine(2503)-C(2))-methyltransferase RlmN [Eubacteriales bacterium]|nr:23S rRNA (adenine(2503)-C(2))-methyltransferase RlmN [Eubacteriales bacterium]